MVATTERPPHGLRFERILSPRSALVAVAAAALVVANVATGTAGQDRLYNLLGVATLVAMVWGVRRHRPVLSAHWWFVGAGVAAFAVSGFFASTDRVWQSHTPPTSVDPGDLVALAGYICIAVAALLLAARGLRRNLQDLVDVAIVAITSLLLVFLVVLAPAFHHRDRAPVQLVVGSYPALGMVVICAVVLLLLRRPANRSLRVLLVAASLSFSGDVVYAYAFLHGGAVGSAWVGATRCLALLALVVAVGHRSMAELGGPLPRRTEGLAVRYPLMFTATIVTSLVAASVRPTFEDTYVAIVAGLVLVVVLVFVRLASLHVDRRKAIAELRHWNRRLETLEQVQLRIAHGSQDLPALLRETVDETLALLGADGVAIQLRSGEELVTHTAAGVPVESDGARTVAAAPLDYAGSRVGALVAIAQRPDAFRDRDVRTLHLLAGVLSVAISKSAEFRAHQALEVLVESSRDALAATALDGTVIGWNAGAEAIYGRSEDDILGRPYAELIVDQGPALAQAIADAASADRVTRLDAESVRADGRHIYVELTVAPVHGFDGGAAGASILARDVTEQRQLEEQLHQSQKLEAIGALAGGIAHDFNNLLVAIQGNTELLLQGDEPPSRHALEIRGAARRASELTQQLLAFSRKQALQPQPVDVDELVEETRQLLTRIVGDGILLTSRCDDAGTVLADRARLGQVIVNLVVNARDAMPHGGTVSIATDRIELTASEAVAVGLEEAGSYVRIVVADTGHGMDAETRRRALEPFFTTKPKGSGTGLGLSTALGTVKQSGGSLAIDSRPGHGTAIRIYLPVLADAAADAPDEALPAAIRGDESVLLVEDDPAVRLVVEEALQASGYRVTVAARPDEALELADDSDRIDLVLSDLVLPGMNGIELTRRVRSRHPAAKVVLTSGYGDDAANGEATFLPKPFSLGELTATVRSVLDAA